MKLNISKKKIVVVAAKALVIGVAGFASGAVVTAAIKNIVPMDGLSRYNKVVLTVGAGLLSGVAGEFGANYVGGIITAIEASINTVGKMFEEAEKPISEVLGSDA